MLAKEVLSYKLSIEVLISKELIDPYISHHEIFSVSNALKEYDYMKKQQSIYYWYIINIIWYIQTYWCNKEIKN